MLGGTMKYYSNLFQFKLEGKVHTHIFDYGEDNLGTYFTNIFTLRANKKKYFLTTSMGTFSTKDSYEKVRVYSIADGAINDSVRLIKTRSGMQNSIQFGYDFFSVADRPERPIKLIQYDEEKKMIFIPIVWENGMVTSKFIRYQFNGKYFVKLKN